MKSLLTFCAFSLLASFTVQAKSIPRLSSPLPVASLPSDSVGIERRDGKLFVLHRIDRGQTLYAIARRYNTSVEVIKAANPGMADKLKYNQTVRIPQPDVQMSRREERAAERAAKREEREAKQEEKSDDQLMTKADLPKNTDVHVVASGQTLYSLAVKYKVLMSDLRRWNNLNNDNILLGQALIVSEKGFMARQSGNDEPVAAEKSDSPKKEPAKPETKPEAATRQNWPASSVERPKPEPNRSETREEASRPEAREERPVRPGDPGTRLPAKGRRMAEIGMAERIEADDSANKYLALHRSAPVGALVQVRNDMSNQSLWVKVIGRLPNTGVNERVLIKLSAKAFEKLSTNNQSFRAEVSYIVP